MKKFEILEHKADLKVRIFGKTNEELFLNAALAMLENLKAILKPSVVNRNIKIKSVNLETLLVDFLSEVLYLTQTEKEVYNNIIFKKLFDNELEAKLFGQKAESFGKDIKAVTYHGLRIKKNKNSGWEATVLFDI